MGWFERTLLAIYSFVTGTLSVILFLIVLGWQTPLAIWENMFRSDQQKFIIAAILLVLFVVSIKMLLTSLQKRVVAHTIIKQTTLGQVNITVEALENLVLKTGYQVTGVKELKPLIKLEHDGVDIVLKAVVANDLNIPALSEQLQMRIKDYIAEVAGIQVREVKILVTNITSDGKARVE